MELPRYHFGDFRCYYLPEHKRIKPDDPTFISRDALAPGKDVQAVSWCEMPARFLRFERRPGGWVAVGWLVRREVVEPWEALPFDHATGELHDLRDVSDQYPEAPPRPPKAW